MPSGASGQSAWAAFERLLQRTQFRV